MMLAYYHDGLERFPHGEDPYPGDIGWYIYKDEYDLDPSGPYDLNEAAQIPFDRYVADVPMSLRQLLDRQRKEYLRLRNGI